MLPNDGLLNPNSDEEFIRLLDEAYPDVNWDEVPTSDEMDQMTDDEITEEMIDLSINKDFRDRINNGENIFPLALP